MLAYALIVVCFIVIAMLWNEGMWSNAITMINIVFTGIIAWNLFEPAATWLESQLKSYTYVCDFLAFWLIFALVFNIFRASTDQISKVKVRFKKPIEQTGNILFAILSAWVMVCIICASFHVAPLSASPFKGSFASEPKAGCFFGLAPDRMWLAFMHTRSKKAMKSVLGQPKVFDPGGEFTLKYATRRKELQAHNLKTDGSIRVKARR